MKKFIMLSAVMAAVSTAFVACSSDDDLAQAPAVPEETVIDTPKGTPFSLSVSAATRAKLYNEDAWDGSDVGDGNWVNQIVLYGKQTDAWLNSNIFVRTSKAADASWTTNRTLTATGVSTPTWPTENTSTPTEFYAITDNDMIIDDDNAAISNVGAWMTTPGTFTYTMDKINDFVPETDPTVSTGVLIDPIQKADYVKLSELKDLMLASATKKESETDGGKLSLTFSHALAGLNIKVIFRNDGVTTPTGTNVDYAEIHYIKIVGLKTSGTYTFNPTGTNPNWNTSAGASICYYKNFDSYKLVDSNETEYDAATNKEDVTDFPDDATLTKSDLNKVYKNTSNNTYKKVVFSMTIQANLESTDAASADYIWLVEKNDPWMVIPQTTVPWNCQAPGQGNYIKDLEGGDNMAYVVLGITDHAHTPDVEVFLPLATTFTAGTNKTLRLDLGKFRDLYQNDSGEAPYYFTPASGGGGARGYDFIDE